MQGLRLVERSRVFFVFLRGGVENKKRTDFLVKRLAPSSSRKVRQRPGSSGGTWRSVGNVGTPRRKRTNALRKHKARVLEKGVAVWGFSRPVSRKAGSFDRSLPQPGRKASVLERDVAETPPSSVVWRWLASVLSADPRLRVPWVSTFPP